MPIRASTFNPCHRAYTERPVDLDNLSILLANLLMEIPAMAIEEVRLVPWASFSVMVKNVKQGNPRRTSEKKGSVGSRDVIERRLQYVLLEQVPETPRHCSQQTVC